PHAAPEAPEAHHRLQPRGNTATQGGITGATGPQPVLTQLRAAPSVFCHQTLMLHQKLPAFITDYSQEAAERAREALCSLAAEVQRGCEGSAAASSGGAVVLQPVVSE
ncbi:unnamed protein product, partial [Closterium sp. NIES-53]